jgi:hypothetical protein
VASNEPDAASARFVSMPPVERVVSHGRVGRELYGLLFILVSLTLAGEYLMSNRFYRDE